MSATANSTPLDRLLEPLAAGFTSEMARYIAEFCADPEVQGRIHELAEKANEGELTDAERREYEEYVEGGTLIAILQAEARRRLSS